MLPLAATIIRCDPEVSQWLQQELSIQRIAIEGESPDVHTVVSAQDGASAHPGLLVIQIRVPTDLEGIRRLRRTFPHWPILAIVPHLNMVLEAMRAGASQVVSLPLDPGDFREALECITRQFGYVGESAETPVVAVAGITGGCGATSLAINLAAEMVHLQPIHCILAELSLRLGQIATYLDVHPRYTIYDLACRNQAADMHLVRGLLHPILDRLEILSGPLELVSLEFSRQQLLELLRILERLCGVLVLDVPCTYDDRFFETLTAASQILLVGEQTVPSVRALKMVSDTLARGSYEWQKMPVMHVVLNKYQPDREGFTVDRIQKLIGVPKIWTIAHDRHVVEAVNGGKTIRQTGSRSVALENIDELARMLLNLKPETMSKKGGFSWISRAFGLAR